MIDSQKPSLESKINEILRKFLANNAKTWEIGTNFFRSLSLFIDSIKDLGLDDANFVTIKKVADNRYQILFNGQKAITPTSKKNKVAAKSTIRQYLQIWNVLGIIKSAKAGIEDGERIELTGKIREFQKYGRSDFVKEFVAFVYRSIYATDPFMVNLGFSLFLCLIDEHDGDLFGRLENFSIDPKTIQRKWEKHYPLRLNGEACKQFIKHIKGENTEKFGPGKQTYAELSREILKTYGFEDIVNAIYGDILETNRDEKISEFALNIVSLVDESVKRNRDIYDKSQIIIEQIQNERTKLRPNIISKRVANQDENYFDLENSELNHANVKYMDACHIYDIKYIIKDFILLVQTRIKDFDDFENNEIRLEIERLKLNASDHNNGILLHKTCHYMFDERLVWFDEDGKLNFNFEDEEHVRKFFGNGYKNVVIKSKTLTPEMRKYLSKRKLKSA